MEPTTTIERALVRLGPVGLASILERLPQVVAALRGDNPFVASLRGSAGASGRRGGPRPELPALAQVLAQPYFVIERLRWLDRFGFQLAALASWHGGKLGRDDAIEAAGPDVADELEEAADRLQEYALAERETAWLALLPGVAERLGSPGITMREYAQQLRTDDLAVMLRNLVVGEVAPRKAERVDQIEAALRDPTVVERALDDVSGEMRGLLEAMIDAGGIVTLDALGDTQGVLLGALYGTFPIAPTRRRHYAGERTPLHELTERGLLVIDPYEELVLVPVDVQVAVRGGLFESWPVAPGVAPSPIAAASPGLPGVLGLLDGLLRRLERTPVDGLKSGGIGVRVIRTLAGQMGLAPAETALLTHLAVELDLLGSIPTSRGTATRAPSTIWTTTAHVDDLREIAPLRRWSMLVLAWLQSRTLADDESLPEKVEVGHGKAGGDPDARRALLEALASLPAGQGVDLDGLVTLADHAHPTVEVASGVEGRVAALRLLGLVPADGPIGLTPLGRALLLDGPDAASQTLPEPTTTFTVQPDHSVIAPPDLDPDVAAQLDRYAVRESSAGASVHRIDEGRLAAALDTGETGDEVLDFLAEHSTAALPQNVEMLVRDVARRHGQMKVGAATSYVTADDPVLIAEAVAVKAAKLRALAPTVAVSSLSRAKLLAALTAKGLMPVAEGADGATISTRQIAEPELDTPGAPLPPDGGILGIGPPDGGILDLAQELLATTQTPASIRSGRGR